MHSICCPGKSHFRQMREILVGSLAVTITRYDYVREIVNEIKCIQIDKYTLKTESGQSTIDNPETLTPLDKRHRYYERSATLTPQQQNIKK